MIEDRDYMRDTDYNQPVFPPGSLTLKLLIAYVLVFIAEIIVSPEPRLLIPGNSFCTTYFALSAAGLMHGYIWQLFTYQFMHAGLGHLFCNGLAIFFFGRKMESRLGKKSYMILVLGSGVVGGLFQVLASLLFPQFFFGGVVGASACAFGLVSAFAVLYPDKVLTFLLFFIIPIQMRARTLLWISAALAAAGLLFPESTLGGNVAHAAHIGGMVAGWLFVKYVYNAVAFSFNDQFLDGVISEPEVKPKTPNRKSQTDAEVDAILDKISAKGLKSLSTKERETLERARQRMDTK